MVALRTGRPVPPVRDTAVVAALLAGATLLVLAWRVRQFRRVKYRRPRSWPRAVAGLVLPLVPLGVLAGLPALVEIVADRRFTLTQLALAMPEVTILLAVAGTTGAAVALAPYRRAP